MIVVEMDRFISQHLPNTVVEKSIQPTDDPWAQTLVHSLSPTVKFDEWAKEHMVKYDIYLTAEQVYVIEFDNLEDFTFYKLSW